MIRFLGRLTVAYLADEWIRRHELRKYREAKAKELAEAFSGPITAFRIGFEPIAVASSKWAPLEPRWQTRLRRRT